MAEGGEYQFHDISVDNINDDVFDELSPLQRSELGGSELGGSALHSELRSELLRDKLNSFMKVLGKCQMWSTQISWS